MLIIENVVFLFVHLRTSASHMFCHFGYAFFTNLLFSDGIQVVTDM